MTAILAFLTFPGLVAFFLFSVALVIIGGLMFVEGIRLFLRHRKDDRDVSAG